MRKYIEDVRFLFKTHVNIRIEDGLSTIKIEKILLIEKTE